MQAAKRLQVLPAPERALLSSHTAWMLLAS
jgi:hypothetical protein